MRTLLLLRHTKSDWEDPELPDRARPLAPRGIRAASQILAHLEAEARPELVLCSSARRAQETLDLVRPALDDATVHIEEDLYGASAAAILARLHAVDAQVRTVLVIGHNPGLEDLTAALAGDADGAALDRLRRKFPTGALAVLDVATEWSELEPGAAHLRRVEVPRRS